MCFLSWPCRGLGSSLLWVMGDSLKLGKSGGRGYCETVLTSKEIQPLRSEPGRWKECVTETGWGDGDGRDRHLSESIWRNPLKMHPSFLPSFEVTTDLTWCDWWKQCSDKLSLNNPSTLHQWLFQGWRKRVKVWRRTRRETLTYRPSDPCLAYVILTTGRRVHHSFQRVAVVILRVYGRARLNTRSTLDKHQSMLTRTQRWLFFILIYPQGWIHDTHRLRGSMVASTLLRSCCIVLDQIEKGS